MTTQFKASRSSIKSCNWPIDQLPGLSPQDCAQLLECGITTTGQLMVKAGTKANKQLLANQLQRPVQYVNKWVAMADLARLPGVGCEYCGLLLHAGVASVHQLAQISAHRLHQQILRLQVATMQRRDLCPSVDRVSQWIQQAQAVSGV